MLRPLELSLLLIFDLFFGLNHPLTATAATGTAGVAAEAVAGAAVSVRVGAVAVVAAAAAEVALVGGAPGGGGGRVDKGFIEDAGTTAVNADCFPLLKKEEEADEDPESLRG